MSLTVTSFAIDQSYVNACSYKSMEEKYSRNSRKIDKRFKITRADILAERAERKERTALLNKLTEAAKANGNAEAITKALGAKSKGDYARLPIEKIRKVVRQVC